MPNHRPRAPRAAPSRLAPALLATLLAALLAGCADPAATEPDAPPFAPAAVSPPSTPAGTRLAEYLDLVAAGDTARTRAYVRASFSPTFPIPAEFVAAMWARQHREHGRLIPVQVTEESRTTLRALVYSERAEAWHRVTLEVEPDPPHRVRLPLLALHAEPPAELAPPPSAGAADAAEELRRYVRRLAAADVFSGAVALQQDGRVAVREAVGYADAARARPNAPGTRFNVGSMGKMFTAVAIAQLVEAGRLSYTTTLGEVLPDYPDRPLASRVTIHHLLTHSAGLGEYMDHPAVRAGLRSPTEMRDYAALIAELPTRFAPGAQAQYSNSGFALLGYVVERVSGVPYREYVRRNVFARAGMADTDFLPNGGTERQAEGLTWFTPMGTLGAARSSNVSRLGAAAVGGADGGSYATADDVLRFFDAFRDGRLVSAATRRTMTAAKVRLGDTGDEYGYGFFVKAVPGGKRYGHGGTVPGGNAWGAVYEPSGDAVVALSNYDPPAADNVVAKSRVLLAGF